MTIISRPRPGWCLLSNQ